MNIELVGAFSVQCLLQNAAMNHCHDSLPSVLTANGLTNLMHTIFIKQVTSNELETIDHLMKRVNGIVGTMAKVKSTFVGEQQNNDKQMIRWLALNLAKYRIMIGKEFHGNRYHAANTVIEMDSNMVQWNQNPKMKSFCFTITLDWDVARLLYERN